MSIAISFENVSKQYRLGEVGTGTLSRDLERAWAKLRGRPDPFAKVGVSNDRAEVGGEYIWALQGIDLVVEQGEILGIIGRNGAGKSTLLKLLSRVTAPTTGSIKAKGRIASLLEVGTGFHPELTGRENIFLNGAILGMNRREVRKELDAIVEFSGCAKYIDTPVKRYSSGMTVRLGFSVAAHLQCEILVVDEVLAVGDAEFQTKCIGRMQDVTSSGRTVLFVSHNMGSIENLCERALFLDNGQIRADTDCQTAIKHYLVAAKNCTKASAPLNQRTDRAGNGCARISKIETCSDGHSTDILASGNEVLFHLDFEVVDTISSARFMIGIKSLMGEPIVMLDSKIAKSNSDTRNLQNGSVACRIDKLPLPPGMYTINIALFDGESLCDHIQDATRITVVEGDFFGTGRLLPSYSAKCLVDHTWKVQQSRN